MRSLMRKMGVGWPGFDPASYEPETVPQALAILQAALDRSSVPPRFTIIGGPTYVFPAHVDLSFAEPLPIKALIGEADLAAFLQGHARQAKVG